MCMCMYVCHGMCFLRALEYAIVVNVEYRHVLGVFNGGCDVLAVCERLGVFTR